MVAVSTALVYAQVPKTAAPAPVARAVSVPTATPTLVPTPTATVQETRVAATVAAPPTCFKFSEEAPAALNPADIKPPLRTGEQIIFKESLTANLSSLVNCAKVVVMRGEQRLVLAGNTVLQRPCKLNSTPYCRREGFHPAKDTIMYVGPAGSATDGLTIPGRIVLDTTVGPEATVAETALIDLRVRNNQVTVHKGRISKPIGGPSYMGGTPLIAVDGEPLMLVIAPWYMPPEGTNVEVVRYHEPKAWGDKIVMALIERTNGKSRLWYFDVRFSELPLDTWKW